jgi:transposase
MTMLKRGPNGSSPNIKRGTAMEYFAGIDVSLEASSLCLVDSAGKIIRETKVASEPDALVEHFASMGIGLDLIGFPAI